MRKMVCLITFCFGCFVILPMSWAVDPRPAEPAVKPVVIEEDAGEAAGQHAPVIEVGSTRQFVKESPLSAAEEDDWYYY